MLTWFNAKKAILVVRELHGGRAFIWEVGRADSRSEGAVVTQLQGDSSACYFFAPSDVAWHAVRRADRRDPRLDIVARNADGSPAADEACVVPDEVQTRIGPFANVAGFAVEIPDGIEGRLFLVDPRIRGNRERALSFGSRFVAVVAPVVHTVYLLQRLRSRAATIERARIGRELHDGIVQTVIGVQIELHALALRAAEEWPDLGDELARLCDVLRQEAITLREMMQSMKPLDLRPEQLVNTIADLVQRFQRETDIAARFVSKLDRVPLPPRACGEVARIVQEALVNVRKHSGARNVIVRFSAAKGHCVLAIDDDGRGFGFTGRLSAADLEASSHGPGVIKERVRLLGGRMIVESDPRCGARLEIAVPLSSHAFQ
jgi:signal transduction histidine kinase